VVGIYPGPNECLVVANDLEQAKGRAFASCEGIIEQNPELKAEVQQKHIYLDNGTTITAISSDYQGASGSNHGWVSYEEIWAVTSESGRRLFEELTSVPTRKNSVKFVATYSGFEGESNLLMDIYKKAVDKDEHPEGQAVRIHPTLPIYENKEARIFCYWDHSARLPWQTDDITPAKEGHYGQLPLAGCMRTVGYRAKLVLFHLKPMTRVFHMDYSPTYQEVCLWALMPA
jgi:hypothetical protein